MTAFSVTVFYTAKVTLEIEARGAGQASELAEKQVRQMPNFHQIDEVSVLLSSNDNGAA